MLKGPEALPCVNNGLFCKSIGNVSLSVHAQIFISRPGLGDVHGTGIV